MKRLLFLLCLLYLFALLGCSEKIIIQGEDVRTASAEDFFDLRLVVRGGKFNICVDKNTGVLYAVGSYNSVFPIMNADGSCLTLDEWKSKKKEDKNEN